MKVILFICFMTTNSNCYVYFSDSQQSGDALTTLPSATQKPTTAHPTATEKLTTAAGDLITTKITTTMALLTTIAKSTTTTTSTGDNEEDAPDGTLPCRGQDGLFPDPADCSSYYQCYGGAGQYNVRYTCSSGLVFNPNYNYCDWPYNYDCASSSNPDPTSSSTERLTTTVPITKPRSTFPTTTEKLSTSVASGVTDETFSCGGQDGLFSDPNDCSSYYQCYGGNGEYHTRYTCAPDTVFNPWCKCCDWSYNYDCSGMETPDPCNGHDGSFADPDDCSSYYQCWGAGKFYTRNTCAAGLVFNPNHQYCDWPDNYVCP